MKGHRSLSQVHTTQEPQHQGATPHPNPLPDRRGEGDINTPGERDRPGDRFALGQLTPAQTHARENISPNPSASYRYPLPATGFPLRATGGERARVRGRLLGSARLQLQLHTTQEPKRSTKLSTANRQLPTSLRWLWALSLVWLMGFTAGCGSWPDPAPVNLSEPGWTVRQGQAIWRSPARGFELTGELLVATHSDGRSFVQFDKAPFPFLVAQASPCGWEIRFVPQNKRRRGRDVPPAKLLWLQLPACLRGDRPAPPCRFTPGKDGRWRLEHGGTGESLEGYLSGAP